MTSTRKLGLIAATTIALAGLLPAAQAQDTTREQRMDQALQNYRNANGATSSADTQTPAYRSADPRNPQPGPAARAEQNIKEGAHNAGNAIKRGAHRTGEAIKHGAQRTGEAVGTGMERSGDAIRRGGEKLKDKSAS
ncbi:hypothetical protein GCM10007320_62760 [Pseudorhodoferax aquiterrae]|uniref:Senescence-associated protein n=1 Tax=Pseudorhodoferax aquiterrae TaxID=747304 RepID=A0ABQ3GE23_9BURK|nr:hypothetical protein [Pseudorhodoferax aquiterrae]GHD03035.1 hypothetical protein GCM10007320_62760 [Pseudorhodoferax aquiterrae]